MTTLDLARQQDRATAAAAGHRWLMLAVLLGGQFMALLDAFVVNVALPSIGADLHASGAALQLVVGGYAVGYAMLLITGARLGDIYGRRRLFLLGVVGFTAASLACGLAPGTAALIGGRCVQGAAAALLVPQIMSVIQMRFTGPARATALSAFGVVISAGAVLGVILGGLLVSADLFGATWRPVFLVNVPFGVLIAALAPRVMPADQPRAGRPGGSPRRLDLRGLAIAGPAVCLVVLPLVLGRDLGWPRWTLACVAAGLLLTGAFVMVERVIGDRGGDPLLNLGVLHAPGLAAGLGTLAAVMGCYGGFLFVFTLHLQAGLGQSALRAGLSYVPFAGLFGLMGYFWRKLPARAHPVLAPAGLALVAAAYLGVALAARGGSAGGPLLWLSLAAAGAGLGAAIAPLLTQALVGVPPSQAADASGLVATAVQLSQVIGVAGFGTVYLSLTQRAGSPAVSSGSALASTAVLLALLAGIGLGPALALTRAVLRAGRTGR
jgi:MFS family permease